MLTITKSFLRASAVIILLACSFPGPAQRIMLKTNALGWGVLTPNLGLETRLSRHNTLNLEAYATPAHYGKYSWKHATFTPEVRHWFSGRPQARHFVGVMALGSVYDMMLCEDIHEGMALGLGVTYGYSFVLGKRWSLELTAGAGYLYRYEKELYRLADPISEYNHHKGHFSPLKAGVTFVYLLK